MFKALKIASTGMLAQQMYVDTTANNLANINTTGYKKARVGFEDLLYENISPLLPPDAREGNLVAAVQIGHGTRPVYAHKIFTQGDSEETGNSLDVLIEGEGFLQFTTSDGTTVYSRDGALQVDAWGRVVNSKGYPLEPEIVVPEGTRSIEISPDGTLLASLVGQEEQEILGQFELAQFVNPAGLEAIGGNLYRRTEATGEVSTSIPGQAGLGTLRQGFLERSNVNIVEEMINMIVAQRAYEINAKAIQTAEDMLALVNRLKR
jgi:flagellar basal-body rod protein FlgG